MFRRQGKIAGVIFGAPAAGRFDEPDQAGTNAPVQTQTATPARHKSARPVAGVFLGCLILPFGTPHVFAQDAGADALLGARPIMGSRSCANSSCHGGADEKSRQVVLWSQHDVHSRAYATLTTARAARMAEALKIPDATTSARCTTCHAPVQTVPPALRTADAHVTEGVSCASCHGPADTWLRSHTRPDFTHADRVAAGMRELRDLYHRANACVACHQTIEPELTGTGRHPPLRFELDGQTQSQPKHWAEPAGRSGAQAWFVGQAVALREMSWALASGAADLARETPRWQAALWLLQRARPAGADAALVNLSSDARPASFTAARQIADAVAQDAARTWSAADTRPALVRLANTHAEFSDTQISALAHACRAERLVLALDRLIAASAAGEVPPGVSAKLDRLFRLVQSQPDFAPAGFARELAAFAALLGP